MNFKPKKINKKIKKIIPPEFKARIEEKKQKRIQLVKNILKSKYFFITALIILLTTTGYALIKNTSVTTIITKNVLKTIGSDLKKDRDGFINILALGVDDTALLTDSILVASIDEKRKNATLISIPRDLYVNDESIIAQRINSVYQNTNYRRGEEEARKTIAKIVGDFVGFPIHYTVMINFQGLVDVVDTLNGIEVYNEQAIYDPFYPGPNYSYQTFSLPQGLQTIDGQTALKFARSRQTTSDFSRAQRQQQLLISIRDKALQLDILTSPDRISELYKSIEKNVKTNLTIRDIISLAGLATDFNRNNILSVVLNNDFNTKGGFLYTPPRSQYMGASVLLPADKTLSQIHTFIRLHRQFPSVMNNPMPIDIVNGTNISGLARNTANVFTRFGFQINQVSSDDNRIENLSETIIETSLGQKSELVNAIQDLFPPMDDVVYIDPITPDPDVDGLPSSVKIITGTDLSDILKFFDVYASVGNIIQQAIQEDNERQQEKEEINDNQGIPNLDIPEGINILNTPE
jgi:LCP family protein required for cell wall assembly